MARSSGGVSGRSAGVTRWRTSKLSQEGAVFGREFQRLERSEARGFARLKRQVGAAAGAHEDLRAPVLVEDHLLDVELLELG